MNLLFRRLARIYARRSLGRTFDGLYAAGLDRTRGLLASGPLLFAANHVGWWDGILLLALDEALGGEGRVLMDAANLARLPFFRPLGAVGLDRSSPAAMRRGLREGAGFLDRPGRGLWVFPQGRHRPPHLRPLDLKRGHELILRASPAVLVPVALQYLFLESPRMRIFVDFGEPCEPAGLEGALVAGLERIDRAAEGEGDAFLPLLTAGGSRPDLGLGARLLALGTRR